MIWKLEFKSWQGLESRIYQPTDFTAKVRGDNSTKFKSVIFYNFYFQTNDLRMFPSVWPEKKLPNVNKSCPKIISIEKR